MRSVLPLKKLVQPRYLAPILIAIFLCATAWILALLSIREFHLWVALWFGLAACVAAAIGAAFPATVAIILNVIGLNLFLRVYEKNAAATPQSIFATIALVAAAACIGFAAERRRIAEERLDELRREFAATESELSSQTADLGRFYELSLKLSSGIELDRMLNSVIAAAASIQHTDLGLLLLPARDPAKLRIHAYCGFSSEQVRAFGEIPASFFPERRRKVIEDIDAAGVYFPFMDAAVAAGFRSVSSVPITTVKGECLGILVTFFRTVLSPAERDNKLVELYARQTANCIENARTYGGLVDTLTAEQRRTAVLRALAEASIKINSALSLDVLLQTITDQARNIVGAQQAYTTFIPKGEWTHNISCASFDEHSPAPEPASKESARFLFACRLNKPIRITAENHADRQWWSLTGNAPERQSVDSWLAAPLLTRDGRNLGLIQLSLKLNGEFTEEDEAIVVQLAQMASVAIENARLYREAQEQITERTRAQEALERSKESMQLAQRSVGIGIWEWDLQRGNLSWSDEISQLHGVSTDTFDGTFEGWINTIHPEDRELVLREVSQALGGGAEYQIQYRVILERGAIRWLESRGQVFSIGSTPIRVIAVALDVTSRKQSEEALRKSEKLATAGRLAATIAHEINNPLAAMTNLLYLLRTSVSRDEQASEHLRSAEAELARVVHITKQTLAFHRELSSPVEIDLPELINDVLTNYSWKLESLNLSVTKKYSPVKALVGYPNELRQVFSNFLLNALEASQANSEIVIRVRDCGDVENSRGIRIMIADHGSGIEPENLSRVFEPFFTTKEDKGTGLGLWVSEGIVHKHGGNIRVRSRSKGKTGTCFSIFLPYTDAQSSRASVGNGAIVAA